jgi:multidrug efflux system membrane fusion protein
LIALLKAQLAQLKAQHSSSAAHGGRSSSKAANQATTGSGSSSKHLGPSGGGGGGSASAILQTTSTQLIVTVDLDASLQSEATVGEHVTVEMPAGNTVNGKITAVSTVAQSSSNSGTGGAGTSPGGSTGSSGSSGSTIPVTIALSGHQSGAGLDQAAVSVNFEKAKANNVLSVPVTALLATSGGNYSVQEAAAPYRLIPVRTGLFAAGYVQISGAGIHPGLRVTDSQG